MLTRSYNKLTGTNKSKAPGIRKAFPNWNKAEARNVDIR